MSMRLAEITPLLTMIHLLISWPSSVIACGSWSFLPVCQLIHLVMCVNGLALKVLITAYDIWLKWPG